MKSSLYLETTIPSYLVGGIPGNLTVAAHQEVTKSWWVEEHENYDIYISPIVEDEVRRGEPEIAKARLDLIRDLPKLDIVPEVVQLVRKLYSYLHLPPKAEPDIYHLALACFWKIDYLLTWNLKHLANGQVRFKLSRYRDATGISIPEICTPEELFNAKG
ncbi:MAG: type II toxin-antitoxin system VapC family toxin [Pirellulales bacterium]|nr:type II toxin-antitoxin system VapC family toxin [Pirellulales bacterium]